MKQNDIPAFPQGKYTRTNAGRNGGQVDVCEESIGGMTLRDYFAIHAPKPEELRPHYSNSEEQEASLRYRLADAMLKERIKTESEG